MSQHSQEDRTGDNISADLAWSVLFESMARAFSYPQQDFFAAIANGRMFQLINECLLVIDSNRSLIPTVDAMNESLQTLCEQHDFASLESDFIALFELNREQPPLHPNAHLYQSKAVDQMSLHQQLNRIYRENGLEIKSEQQADHLCVQLNFMAWLYRQADSSGDIPKYYGVLQEFHPQLLWIGQFAQQLEARQHWLYAPMSRLLVSLIELSSQVKPK